MMDAGQAAFSSSSKSAACVGVGNIDRASGLLRRATSACCRFSDAWFLSDTSCTPPFSVVV